jgi:Pyruvate/2-oxoacid:ferredoxin oxidoreductase delta subunit
MAVRNIVRIDEDKCTGCGLCATACAEGAIQIVHGKARLVSDSYCDGLGACLGHCPEGAITIGQREAGQFDEKVVQAHLAQPQNEPLFVCPGLASHQWQKEDTPKSDAGAEDVPSQLSHWPVQLELVSPTAPQFADADLLLVADCVPFSVGDFHRRYLKDHSLVVGCPKLDNSQSYIEKVAQIVQGNNLRSLMVVHMEVP